MKLIATTFTIVALAAGTSFAQDAGGPNAGGYVSVFGGPVWSAGKAERNKELLASCYRNSLALAGKRKLRSIAFPAISTGVYRFPPDLAARIAVETVVAALPVEAPLLKRVIFCCFDSDTLRAYEDQLEA